MLKVSLHSNQTAVMSTKYCSQSGWNFF